MYCFNKLSFAKVLFFCVALGLPMISMAEKIDERPSASEMTLDMLFVRPAMFVGTLLGTGIYVISLPVSLLGGNAKEAANKLVVSPFRATFLRCLGCTRKHMPVNEQGTSDY